MKKSSNFNLFVDEIITESLFKDVGNIGELKNTLKENHSNDLEEKLKIKAKKWLYLCIFILFIASNVVLFFSLYYVFTSELDLIASNKLPPNDRSIDSDVIKILIAATMTQTAVAFMLVTRSILGTKKDSD